MKKSTSDDLFHLIHSLGKAEKAHFKKSVKTIIDGNKPFYIELFDFLEKQKNYDENMLLKRFRPISVAKLSFHKNYLYNLILKTLQSFNESISVSLRNDLNKIEFLFDKKLYRQCEKLILKSKLVAEKYGKHVALTELVEFEAELMHVQSYSGKTSEDVDVIFNQILNSIDKCRNYNEYRYLSSQLFIERLQRGFIRSTEELKLYDKFLNHPLFTNETKALSYQALNSYFAFHAVYSFDSVDYKRAYHYSQKLVQLIENNPLLLEEKPSRYVTAINNLITCLERLGMDKEIYLNVEKLKQVKCKTPEFKAQVLQNALLYEVESHIHQGQFNECVKMVENYFKKFKQGKDSIFKNLEFSLVAKYDFCCLYFGLGNYSKANQYLNEILNNPTDTRSDVYCMTKIISLLIQFELNDTEQLEHSVRSACRYLLKRNRLYKFEDAVLNFIRKRIPKANTTSQLISAFKELRKELIVLSENQFEKRALEYFDFISWLESKIENRPFAEVVRNKIIRAQSD